MVFYECGRTREVKDDRVLTSFSAGRPGAGGAGMRVKQAFRYELDPNVAQRQALARHVGAARFA